MAFPQRVDPNILTKLGNNDTIFVGIYRPPRQSSEISCSRYIAKVEEELNEMCMWAQKQLISLLGDLNMDRLRPETGEGKILKDLENVHGLQCMITEPTRITQTSETQLDVIPTNPKCPTNVERLIP